MRRILSSLKKLFFRADARAAEPMLREPSQEQQTFFGELIPSGSLVFDVGANIGDKTAVFLALGARVVAFEPQPECAAALHRRFKNEPCLEIVQAGIARESGEMELQICSAAPVISTFSTRWQRGRFSEYTWDRSVSVPVMTLDGAISRFGSPQFIKVDVEGFEVEVLAGLSSRVGGISFEFAREFLDQTKACMEMLRQLGYREFNIGLAEECSLVFGSWQDHETVVDFIETSADSLLWGDIYARGPRHE